MPQAPTKTRPRREQSLSRDQIIQAATEILDAGGEDALTFRTLSHRLATGPGALYWHVANKNDLLTAACDAIIARTLNTLTPSPTPQTTLRLLALALFDTIDDHPWVGSALTRALGQSPMIRIVEAIGRQIDALGVPPRQHWVTVSALLNYILGVGGRNAANGQYARTHGLDRSEFLHSVSTAWSQLDPAQYPFARTVAPHMRIHDDRTDFLAGVDLILQGIASQSAL